MAVNKVNQTAEEKKVEEQEVREKGKKVVDDVLSSLDLPETEEKEKPKSKVGEGEEIPSGEKEEEGIDDEEEETEEEEEEEEEEESEEDTEGEEGEEGDLIPKSKHNKVVKKLTKRVDALTRKIKIAETTAKQTPDTRDPDTVKLEAKTVAELKTLKREIRLRQAKLAREEESEETNTKLNQLVDLEMKIDNVITSAPQRFYDGQVALYNDKAAEVYDDPDIEDIDTAAPVIKKIAQQIYADYPKLQKVEDGQALALGLAVDHYKALQKESSGKSKVKDLKRAQNKMKRKTSLDTSKVKGNVAKTKLESLRKRAFRGSSIYDKEALVLHDPRFNIDALIPAEYKEE